MGKNAKFLQIAAKLTSLSIAFFAIATPALASTFPDVPDTETYKTAIDFLSDMGIVQGNPDGTFRPLNTLNRAEMLKIITEGSLKYHKTNDATASTDNTGILDNFASKSCFNDVQANIWYTKYVCYGKEKGWVTGYDGGKTFKPTQNVNFVEALKMSYKAFGLSYDDKANPWYKDLVDNASSKNYIPFTITAFSQDLQRAQMADMITRMIKYDKGGTELEAYLGARNDTVVTYDTIEKGQDLSKLEVKVVTP